MAKVRLPIFQRTQLTGGDWGTGDPDYDSVVLLVSFEEEDRFGETNDWSQYNHSVTFGNSATVDTTLSRFSGSRFGPSYSGIFDSATDDFAFIPDAPELRFGSGAFTIECHVRFTTLSAIMTLLSKWDSSGGGSAEPSWVLTWRTSNELRFDWAIDSTGSSGNGGFFSRDWTPSTDTWYHVALSYTGSVTRMFIDGIQIGADYTGLNGQTLYEVDTRVEIGGAIFGSGRAFSHDGNIDNVRFTKGVARYTENFTPPQAPYPNYKKRTKLPAVAETDPFFSNVVFLTDCEGTDGSTTLSDQSNDDRSITFANQAQIDTSQAATGSSSILFDGNGDYIQVPDASVFDIGSNDYTFEFDVRFNDRTSPDGMTLLDKRNNGAQFGWAINIDSTNYRVGVVGWASGGATPVINLRSTVTSLLNDQWYTIAITRDGGNWNVYVDGTREATGSETNPIGANSSNFRVGLSTNTFQSGRPLDGWIDNIRITNGVARYTEASYTVPARPYPTS